MDRFAMQRAVLGVDERFYAAPPVSNRHRPWRADELALLREQYPIGGVKAALAVLPERSRKAIYTKADELGLRAPAPTHLPTKAPTRYPSTEAIDAEVRRVYQAGPNNAELNALARRLMRPRAWIMRRAGRLGLVTPSFAPVEWHPEEIKIIERHAHQSYDWIRTLLRQRGWQRTASAIATKVKLLELDRSDPDNWTTYQLAPVLGVAPLTIRRWILQEGLPARREGTRSETDPYMVNRDDLRRWIATHPQLVDLRKVERYWFIELLTSPPTKPGAGQRKAAV
jgi:hypothetical protein